MLGEGATGTYFRSLGFLSAPRKRRLSLTGARRQSFRSLLAVLPGLVRPDGATARSPRPGRGRSRRCVEIAEQGRDQCRRRLWCALEFALDSRQALLAQSFQSARCGRAVRKRAGCGGQHEHIPTNLGECADYCRETALPGPRWIDPRPH